MYCTVIQIFSILFLCIIVLMFRLGGRHFLEDLAVNSGITLKWCLKKWVKCVLSLIYSYVAVCKCCAVSYLIITGFTLLFLITRFMFYNILFMFAFCFLFFISIFVFCIFVLFLYCFMYYFSFCALSFLFLYESIDHCYRSETQLQ